MAFTGNFVTTSFKVDLLNARHNFAVAGNSFKLALYTNSATLTAATTAYTATGEHAATGTYVAGGKALTNIAPSAIGTTAICDFTDLTWAASTITARGALIYNDTITTPVADASVVVLDFGSDKISSAGDFTVVFPAADATNAIIRIA
jgi:hypothetical protein